MRFLVALIAAFTVMVAPAAAKTTKPTIVLVHGAFADASGWNGVTERLQDKGYKVLAPANPLRGVTADATYLKNVLSHINGPIVLAGHSYGGVAITNAATGNANVKALVYVAGFIPAQGETVQALSTPAGGAKLGVDTLDIHPDGTGTPAPNGLEGTIKVSAFRDVFAADLPRKLAAVMAASQRPASLVTLGEPSGAPAWSSIPSWAVIPTKDNTIGTGNLRTMAKRAKAKITEVKGASHVVMTSQPGVTTDVILRAVRGK